MQNSRSPSGELKILLRNYRQAYKDLLAYKSDMLPDGRVVEVVSPHYSGVATVAAKQRDSAFSITVLLPNGFHWNYPLEYVFPLPPKE